MASQEPSRRRRRDRDRDRDRERERERRHARRRHHGSAPSARRYRPESTTESSLSQPASQGLSADSLATLNLINREAARREEMATRRMRRKRNREVVDENLTTEREKRPHRRRKNRIVSGSLLEEGESAKLRGLRGGGIIQEEDQYEAEERSRKKKKRIWIGIGLLLVLIIIIAVAVSVSNKKSSKSSDPSSSPSTNSGGSSNDDDVPTAAKGTYLDPATWYDTTDFNTTYTNETVGGLPIMGLFTDWDDSKSANKNTPPINKPWGSYANMPVRGVNLGGWLSLEPFITPSLFNYDPKLGIVDEYTLCQHLGPDAAKSTLEQHYATFVTEQTFIDIAAAGLDHVRIPYSYWAVVTYPGDPYVFRTSWRYLLRAIEWARKHGLRINLDLHGLPGSQNGWNHSGRLGPIGWLNGTDGDLNSQRSLDVHNQLSQFFAQPRYQNIISFYGLANEPKMISLDTNSVIQWSENAYNLVRKNGINAYIVFGDGFLGLTKWQGQFQGYDGMVLDVHQYVIFNIAQIVYNHTAKVQYACQGWSEQSEQSMNTATGFGPTIFAEWSQADTDCAPNLNNVGWGTRWQGTYASGDPTTQVLSPDCPTQDSTCDCTSANADPGTYSDAYKQFLKMFAEAQMASFEKGWGWFYWTWVTESATQWSYKDGLAAGILPKLAYQPDFDCTQDIPSFVAMGLSETY
ncbi:exo-beta-1,3-glucanase [Xylogone sp. PMI_703]|nr:exo-beta-1,3-glucanase [Xylogone sp. PMI_703]